MSLDAAARRADAPRLPVSPTALTWISLLVATFILTQVGSDLAKALDARWLTKMPGGWRLDWAKDVSAAMKWLVEDATFGLFTFTDLTRGIAWLIEQPYNLALALLSTGLLKGVGSDAIQLLPPLTWVAVTAAAIALGHYARDWTLAALAGGALVYLAIFGQWDSAMVTLASIVIAVPIGVAGGLLLGIAAYRAPWFERINTPILDLMQTIPIFAYLVPILFMFGFGPVSALVATVIYAMPPMVRITTHSLRAVDPEIVDFGTMAGCTPRQMMWRVLIPSASAGLMVGVNQVIMLSLNMVIIASMIGAGGLGFDVLAALRRLDIGGGLESGIAIVVLAIALDRLSQAFAQRRPDHHEHEGSWLKRHPRTLAVVAIIVVTFLIGRVLPAVQDYPKAWAITTGPFWAGLVEWLNVNLFDTLEAIKTALLTWFLLPIKRFLLGIPWPWGIALAVFAGWHFGRWKLAALAGLLAAFIAFNGLWDKAMTTVYLCGASVIIATLIGVPLGIWAARSERRANAILLACDTAQTFPSFIYLIPVVMLFGVNDVAAIGAVIVFGMVPMTRYTIEGLRGVPVALTEAADMSGANARQKLVSVRLPLALPTIAVGLNQTVMFSLFMVIIAAFIGTRDLGQEMQRALSATDVGKGLVLGLCVAFMGLLIDHVIVRWSSQRKKDLGID